MPILVNMLLLSLFSESNQSSRFQKTLNGMKFSSRLMKRQTAEQHIRETTEPVQQAVKESDERVDNTMQAWGMYRKQAYAYYDTYYKKICVCASMKGYSILVSHMFHKAPVNETDPQTPLTK